MSDASPFHAGERRAQARAGVPEVAQWASGYIRPSMPEQHRTFFAQLPFLVVAGADAAGQHWVSLIDGPDDFIGTPNANRLTVDTTLDPQDPVSSGS